MEVAALYALLDTLQIPFERVEHPPLSAIADFHAAGITFPGQNVKCLFLRNRKGKQFYLLIVDELKNTDLAALAAQIGESSLSFASAERLQAILGVAPGAVTPFALAREQAAGVSVLLDSTLDPAQLIGFHPLVNSETLCIPFPGLLTFLAHTGHPPRSVTV